MIRPPLLASALVLPLLALAGADDTLPKTNDHGGPIEPPAGVSSRKRPLELEDKGTSLENDPYKNWEQLTTGRMERFIKLYVDPDSWPGSVRPAAPFEPAMPKGPIAAPAVRIALNADTLSRRKLTAAQIRDRLAEALPTTTVKLDAEGAHVFVFWPDERPPEPDAEGSSPGAAHVDEVSKLYVGSGKAKVAVGALGELSYGPAPTGAGPSDGVMPTQPPRPTPASGTLDIENNTTAWAEVQVNGEKVGTVRPVITAMIHDLPAGFYDVTLTLPNGFTWTRRVATGE